MVDRAHLLLDKARKLLCVRKNPWGSVNTFTKASNLFLHFLEY